MGPRIDFFCMSFLAIFGGLSALGVAARAVALGLMGRDLDPFTGLIVCVFIAFTAGFGTAALSAAKKDWK